MAPLFLLKLLSNQSKSFSNLIFSQIFWLFCLFLFTLNFAETTQLIATEKELTFWFWRWQKCESPLSVIKEVWYKNQCNSYNQWTNGFSWKNFETFSLQLWKICVWPLFSSLFWHVVVKWINNKPTYFNMYLERLLKPWTRSTVMLWKAFLCRWCKYLYAILFLKGSADKILESR